MEYTAEIPQMVVIVDVRLTKRAQAVTLPDNSLTHPEVQERVGQLRHFKSLDGMPISKVKQRYSGCCLW